MFATIKAVIDVLVFDFLKSVADFLVVEYL